jgi:UDP-N-acetylmuramyl pentapeptide phosphotransferase/UDP-N-acetylglucosamine-1-phosphate transferase
MGVCLAASGNAGAASLAFSLMGAIVGFLRFNTAPARIFMGDTGSLLLGYTISALCIIFVNSYNEQTDIARIVHSPASALVIGLSILFVPVFDSFRVFSTRLMRGVSPFKADRSHLHHYLLDIGFTHSRTVTILITANILIITVSLIMQDFNPNLGILAILVISFGLFGILYYMRKQRLAYNQKLTKSLSKSDLGNSKISTSGITNN